MPNRILKESICTSDNLNGLSADEEILFYRILVNADDYGRMDARATIVRSRCFPLRIDQIKGAQIEAWLNGLQSAGLIILYGDDERRYLQIVTWEKHQQVRARRSKYPSMEELASKRKQVTADDGKCPRNPIQSNPTRNPNLNPDATNAETKGERVVSGPAVKLAERLKSLILRNNPTANVRPGTIDKWSEEIERMITNDRRPLEDIEAVIEFSQNDEFWHTNILSARNLREKYDRLWLKMKNGEKHGRILGSVAPGNESRGPSPQARRPGPHQPDSVTARTRGYTAEEYRESLRRAGVGA